jgi:hypothetical protein
MDHKDESGKALHKGKEKVLIEKDVIGHQPIY